MSRAASDSPMFLSQDLIFDSFCLDLSNEVQKNPRTAKTSLDLAHDGEGKPERLWWWRGLMGPGSSHVLQKQPSCMMLPAHRGERRRG